MPVVPVYMYGAYLCTYLGATPGTLEKYLKANVGQKRSSPECQFGNFKNIMLSIFILFILILV